MITQYHMAKDSARRNLFNATSGFVVAIKSGEGAAKATAINALDLVIDLRHGVKYLSTNATSITSSVNSIGSAMVPVAASAGIAAGIVTGLELCYVTYNFFIGDIPDWATYGRLVTRSIATGVGSFVGNCAGYLTGAFVGGAIGSIGGPGGVALGAFIGGIIGSIFGSIAGGASASQAFNKCWPDEEQKSRKILVKEALMQYGYTENDIKNDAIFNETMIKAKYKMLCLIHHPDRETGSTQAFQQLSINHGIVWSLLNSSTNKKDDAVKIMIEAGV
ncbi:unnamed protein product [Rotaria sordida]|uniref:J domain-containing protein n=1 Tax=Rotaria sordida TaxID=392033 RepID=A0A815CVQ3_9BILA|nr:unnamed protein product [Rotaria sordida]CAF1273691.1 unnamed protein product [Rotaria sordida]CAF1288032.1 unnamed protein product [Rotaria sordida]CAF1553050.1 unnamed protein product [Rotaria sordida]CAF3856226.1 unnamed protein product [Rotaria sordida]